MASSRGGPPRRPTEGSVNGTRSSSARLPPRWEWSLEDKVYSLAVHYRRSRNKKRVKALVEELASTLDQVRVIGGIEVVNIVPADAPHKGMALERERARLKCDTAIYVGDDVTDEDVFALDQPGRLLTIRVGQKLASQADYFIKSQAEIDTLIGRLISLREEKGGADATAKGSGRR
jgi:trehalose 6-phosphate phosphatase